MGVIPDAKLRWAMVVGCLRPVWNAGRAADLAEVRAAIEAVLEPKTRAEIMVMTARVD